MRKHKSLWLLTALLCLWVMLAGVSATEPRTGSLTVVDIDNPICLQYVATPDAALTQAFAGAPVESLSEQTAAVANARILYAWAVEHDIPGLEKESDEDGIVFYGDLAEGLYLVYSLAQEPEFNPFLVKIPTEVAGETIYDVEAAPKEDEPTEPDTPPTEPSGPPTEPDTPPTEPDDPDIPQTGTSVWPKYILLTLGVLAAIAGATDLILGREKQR